MTTPLQPRRITTDQFAQLLAKHRLVDEAAIYDPDGFDHHRTLVAINCAFRELCDQPEAPTSVPDETPGHSVAPDGKPWPSQLEHLVSHAPHAGPAGVREAVATVEDAAKFLEKKAKVHWEENGHFDPDTNTPEPQAVVDYCQELEELADTIRNLKPTEALQPLLAQNGAERVGELEAENTQWRKTCEAAELRTMFVEKDRERIERQLTASAARVKELEAELADYREAFSTRNTAGAPLRKIEVSGRDIERQNKEFAALRTRCAELEKDGARLDWFTEERRNPQSPLVAIVVKEGYVRDGTQWINADDDPRAAIDSAMNATRPPEGANETDLPKASY